jgi:hypothetical protein
MKKITILAIFLVLALAILACSSQSATAPTAVDQPASAPAMSNLGDALNLVNGTSSRPSVFSSYHIEVSMNQPSLSDEGKSVVIKVKKLTADVEGKNVHVFYNYQSDPTMEGYILGDGEYLVTAGKPQKVDVSPISTRWAFWPVEVVPVFAASAIISQKSGTGMLDGRRADVYSVDTAGNPSQLQTLNTMGIGFKAFNGKIWIDKQTGGLLQTSMDFTMDVYSQDASTVIGSGDGHLDLSISKIGQISVNLP